MIRMVSSIDTKYVGSDIHRQCKQIRKQQAIRQFQAVLVVWNDVINQHILDTLVSDDIGQCILQKLPKLGCLNF